MLVSFIFLGRWPSGVQKIAAECDRPDRLAMELNTQAKRDAHVAKRQRYVSRGRPAARSVMKGSRQNFG
jgi:hypothetical protein